MKNKQEYVQCVLRKNNLVRTSWIPKEFAIPGKILKLRDNDKWDDGWQVEQAGSTTYLDDLDINRSIREHKKRTGDSLPKEGKEND